MVSCASDVFSQVMSLAKWLNAFNAFINVPSYGVCQVTGWKSVVIFTEDLEYCQKNQINTSS